MIIIYYSNLFSNFKHCFIWLRGCLKMKFTMNESKNLKSQWMKLCKRSRSKSRQIWVIDRDRDQESWINRDRDQDRDHKSAFDRDRDSSKLPIPVPGIPVDYCDHHWIKMYPEGANSYRQWTGKLFHRRGKIYWFIKYLRNLGHFGKLWQTPFFGKLQKKVITPPPLPAAPARI